MYEKKFYKDLCRVLSETLLEKLYTRTQKGAYPMKRATGIGLNELEDTERFVVVKTSKRCTRPVTMQLNEYSDSVSISKDLQNEEIDYILKIFFDIKEKKFIVAEYECTDDEQVGESQLIKRLYELYEFCD